MTETPLPQPPMEVFAERVEQFSEEFVRIQRERAALDAQEARLLARTAAFADATAEVLVVHERKANERRALVRRSMCATLAMAARLSERTVQVATGIAEALVNDTPTVLASLGAGRISSRHAQIIVDQLRDVPVAGRTVFLAEVLPVAERSNAARLTQRARVLRERLHPESITVRAIRSEADRRAEIEPAADGMAWVHLFTTAPLAQAIGERIESAAADARAAGDMRSCAQLQADALGALAISGVTPGTLEPSAILPHPVEVLEHIRATVHLTVPALTVLGVNDTPGMLDGYGPIDPETAARLAVTAPSMTRVLTHPETGAVLSVGRDQYRVPADLQRAVRLRDGTCRAPGCGRRARACDLDHSVAWEHGGTTSVGNLACVCRHHHRLKHLPGWSLDHQPDGVLEWTTPDGRTHRTEPEPAPF